MKMMASEGSFISYQCKWVGLAVPVSSHRPESFTFYEYRKPVLIGVYLA